MSSGRSIRIFDRHGEYPPPARYSIGEVWEMDITPRAGTRPPHSEDVLVQRQTLIRTQGDVEEAILAIAEPWGCRLDEVFEQTLSVAQGKLYLAPGREVPTCSTGFWIADRSFDFDDGGTRYFSIEPELRSIKFVGLDAARPLIQQGDLVRLSLASWYQGDYLPEERCYLQVSGSFGPDVPGEHTEPAPF